MGRNLFEKILGAHLIAGELKAGAEIEIRVDQTLTQDVLGTMAYLQYEAIAEGQVKTPASDNSASSSESSSSSHPASSARRLSAMT